MNLDLDIATFKASDIFSFEQVAPLPGLPDFFNLHFKSTVEDKTPLVGPGIYIIAFDGEPVYLGKYLGVKDAPFSGNVIDLRWSKHIATLTMRGKRLSMSSRALKQSIQLAPKSAFVRSLNDIDKDMLHRDRGCQTTARRLQLAHKNWGDFASLDSMTLERFTFTYLRLLPSAEDISTTRIREFVSHCESTLINEYWLPCNSTKYLSADLKTVTLDDLVEKAKKVLNENLKVQNPNSSFPEPKGTNIVATRDLEEELLSPFEVRLEQAPPWALEFVTSLISHFEDKESVEVHYTNTNCGDMRIRVYWKTVSGAVRGQNFATLEWGTGDEAFLINTEAAAKDVSDLAMTIKGKTLPAQLKLTEAVYKENKDSLTRLFENAAILIKARHGAILL